jgi:hypothetical protein
MLRNLHPNSQFQKTNRAVGCFRCAIVCYSVQWERTEPKRNVPLDTSDSDRR